MSAGLEAVRIQDTDIDLDAVERELAEEEETLATRLQVARRQGDALAARLRHVRESVRALGDEDAAHRLGARLARIDEPAMDGEQPLAGARAARRAAVLARRQAHAGIQAALAGSVQMFSQLGRELQEIEHEVESARATPPPAKVSAPVPVPPPKLPAGAERRQHARVRFERAVDLWTDDNFYTGFANDISTGGLFIATLDPPAAGTIVELAFVLPDGTRVETDGEVRWTREYNDHAPFLSPGAGIQFKRITPEALQAIQRFVSKRETLFFPD